MIVLIADYEDTVAAAYAINKALMSLLWLTSTWAFLAIVRIFFWEGIVEKRRGQKVPVLLTNLFRLVVLMIAAVFVAVTVFNISELAVALLLGGTAAFVALFFRDFLSEIFAGLSINLDQGIDIGFHLQLESGMTGLVQEMNWRSVTLLQSEGTLAIVPNSVVAQQVVINLNSLGDRKKISFELTLDYSLPVIRAIRVLNAALISASRLQGIANDPAPEAYADGPGSFGVIYRLVIYYHSRKISEGAARSIVSGQVMKHLHGAGLTVALPKQNVFVGEARMMSMSWEKALDRELLIANIPLFQSLEEAELKKLAESMIIHEVAAGKEVISEGDMSTSMFGLAEGVLEVTMNSGERQLVVAIMEPGNFFGEMSMLAGEPRSATVTTLVDSMIFEIQRESFSEILNSRSEVAESVSRLIIERQMSNDEKLQDASRQEIDDAISDASTNLLDRIRSVFSAFK